MPRGARGRPRPCLPGCGRLSNSGPGAKRTSGLNSSAAAPAACRCWPHHGFWEMGAPSADEATRLGPETASVVGGLLAASAPTEAYAVGRLYHDR